MDRRILDLIATVMDAWAGPPPGRGPGHPSAETVRVLATLRPVELSDPDEGPPSDAPGYVFADEEIDVAAWVQEGRVEAGALSDQEDWDRPEKNPPDPQGGHRGPPPERGPCRGSPKSRWREDVEG